MMKLYLMQKRNDICNIHTKYAGIGKNITYTQKDCEFSYSQQVCKAVAYFKSVTI